MAPLMLVPAGDGSERLQRKTTAAWLRVSVARTWSRLEKSRCSFTSGRRQREDELLGVSDVVGGDGHEAARLPDFDPAGEADEVEVVSGSQVAQDGEEGFFGLTRTEATRENAHRQARLRLPLRSCQKSTAAGNKTRR